MRAFFISMKTVIIIGSTGTIGQKLVELNKKENCIEASRSLKEEKNQFHLDLTDFESVLHFLNYFANKPVDVLYMNSGLVCNPSYTKDGIDTMWMVNAFAPYYLIKHFLKTHPQCKIIVTSSISILHAKLNFHPKKYKYMYRNTKLLEHMLIFSLEEEDQNNFISFAHPGIVSTKISTHLHHRFINFWIRRFGNSASNAAKIIVQAEEIKKKGFWVCPSGIFGLRGKPVLKKIPLDLELEEKLKEQIKNKEQELEEKYGISCNGL